MPLFDSTLKRRMLIHDLWVKALPAPFLLVFLKMLFTFPNVSLNFYCTSTQLSRNFQVSFLKLYGFWTSWMLMQCRKSTNLKAFYEYMPSKHMQTDSVSEFNNLLHRLMYLFQNFKYCSRHGVRLNAQATTSIPNCLQMMHANKLIALYKPPSLGYSLIHLVFHCTSCMGLIETI